MKKRSLAILAGGMSLALLPHHHAGPSSARPKAHLLPFAMKPDSRRLRSL